MNNQLDEIKSKIQEYKNRYFTKKLINGTILLISIVLISFLFFSVLEYYGNFGSTARKILFFSFMGILCTACYLHLFVPIKNLIFKNSVLSDQESSALIGNHFPEIKDKLLNTLQLAQLNHSQNSLILASISQKSSDLKAFNFKNAIDFEESKKYLLYYLLIPTLIFVSILIFDAKTLSLGSHRLVHFNKEFVPQAPFEFDLQNKNLNVFESENVELKLNLVGNILPEEVYIVSRDGRYLMSNEKGIFKHSMYNINSTKNFWFEAAGYNSKTHTLNIIKRPSIENIQVQIEYPSYLKIQNKVSDNIGNISVPEGTKITWIVNTKETNKINFVFNDSLSYTSDLQEENVYKFNKRINKNLQYSIELKNSFGGNKDKINYTIESIEDKFPNINLEHYTDTVLYEYLLVGGAIGDDYGISNLRLHYKVENDKSRKNEKYKIVPLSFNKTQTNQNFVFQLKLKTLDLKSGDKIEYFVSVSDNDGVNGVKTTKSTNMTFSMPTNDEVENKQELESENNKNELAEAISKTEKINAEIKKLSNQLKTKKELSWQDKKDLEKVLQKHRELQSEIQNLNQQIEQQNQQQERFDKADPELAEKIKQLENLMKEMIDPETKKLMEELRKLMENQSNVEEISKKLDELNKKDESFEKELDRALEMYKQMEFEKKLDKSIDKLKELSQKQKELQKETEKSSKEEQFLEINKKQEELNKEFNKTKEELKEIEKANQELENKHELEDLKQDQKDTEQNMENSSEQLEKNNAKNAAQSQENASDKMKAMAKKMQDMKEAQENEALEENIEDLKKIMDNLIKLSFKQEEVINKLSGLNTRDPLFIEYSQKQLNIEKDSEVLEDSLYALAKRLVEIESVVTKQVTELKNELKESSEFIKQRNTSRALVKQQYAMTSMNNLALLLDDILDNLQEQMIAKKSGDQMCNKPGNKKGGKQGKPKQGMGDLQKQLNDMIKQLQEGQKAGKSMSSELAKAAARQEMLRRGLSELKKGSMNGTENQKLSEEIKNMEKAMEETEKELLNNKLSEKTVQRNQQILTRLLEAENATKERDLDQKRKATEAKSQTNTLPPNYDKYLKNKQKQIELLQTIPPTLSPYYKKEVNEYFDTIDK